MATKPAATIIAGSVAVVHEVTAAIARAPCSTGWVEPSKRTSNEASPTARPCSERTERNRSRTPDRATRLWDGRTRQRRLDAAKVDIDDIGETDALALASEGALQLEIRTGAISLGLRRAGAHKLGQGCLVDGEQRGGASVLRRHVGDGRALRRRKRGDAGTEALAHHAHDAAMAQSFGEGQRDVHGGNTRGEPPREANADDSGDAHGDGLAQGRCLGLDAAHSPTEDAHAVRGGRMGVRSHKGVEVQGATSVPGPTAPRHAAEPLDIELMADAHARRNDLNVGEA